MTRFNAASSIKISESRIGNDLICADSSGTACVIPTTASVGHASTTMSGVVGATVAAAVAGVTTMLTVSPLT